LVRVRLSACDVVSKVNSTYLGDLLQSRRPDSIDSTLRMALRLASIDGELVYFPADLVLDDHDIFPNNAVFSWVRPL
jgi:hypothetical protein